jgi:hypothetical protein
MTKPSVSWETDLGLDVQCRCTSKCHPSLANSVIVTALLVGSLQQMRQSDQAPRSTFTVSNPVNLSPLLRDNALVCSSLFTSFLCA